MFQISNFFSSKLHFNASSQPIKQPETNPFHVSSSALFDLKEHDVESDQISFLQNLQTFQEEVAAKKSLLDGLKTNVKSIASNIEVLTSVADMGHSLCDAKKDNKGSVIDTYVLQKTQIRVQLDSERIEYSDNHEKLQSKIEKIFSELNEFQQEISSCFKAFNQGISKDSLTGIQKIWNSNATKFKSLVEQIQMAHEEYSILKNKFNLDEFENKLKADSVSSASAAYQMANGRYLYSVKREFQNSEPITLIESIKDMDRSIYFVHYRTLIDCIEKIQNDVNHGVPSHEIVKSYSSRLNFMNEVDVKKFFYKLIVASIHKNPLSRYKNEKTKTISNMISDLKKLGQEKINPLKVEFRDSIFRFNEKFYLGVIGDGKKLAPVARRLELFISDIKAMQQHVNSRDTYEIFKSKHENRLKSFYIIKDEFLDEVIRNIFIMSQHENAISRIRNHSTNTIEQLIKYLESYRLLVKDKSTLIEDYYLNLPSSIKDENVTFIGTLAGGSVYYVKEQFDAWNDNPWSGTRHNTDRDGYYYETVAIRNPYSLGKGIFYDEQGREVHRVNC